MELGRLLDSLREQERAPDQVIVVAAGQQPATEGARSEDGGPGPEIVRARTAGANAQRNQALERLDPRCDWVVSLDDDVVLHCDCLAELVRVSKAQPPTVGGIGLNIVNETAARLRRPKKWFGMDGDRRGAVLPSSFNTLMCPLGDDETLEVDWLHAGASAWRAGVARQFPWEERFQGYALYDDVEYSLRVGEQHRLVAAGACRVEHHHATGHRAAGFDLGTRQIHNHAYIVAQHPGRLSQRAHRKACVGQLLSNLARGTLERDLYLWQVAAGNAVALAQIALNRHPRLG